MRTHAQLPTPGSVRGDEVTVLFAGRDAESRSHVGAVDVRLGLDPTVIGSARGPLLEPGPLGHFDDHGVYPASIVEPEDGLLYLYYIGWNPGLSRPLFYASIGLAISEDGGFTFRRASAAPVMGRSDHDPCLVTSPCVLLDGGIFRMWYVSGFRWTQDETGLHSHYHVKYAESTNGIDWRREGRVCIELEGGERNIARPWVVPNGPGYRMWFSSDSGSGYRIAYAESSDGLEWQRLGAVEEVSPQGNGWESTATAYPAVIATAAGWVMLYNGDGFGRDGFGAAVASAS